MATKKTIRKGTRSLSPFGATDDHLEPIKFEGSAEELDRALEASFNPKPAKVKTKKIIKRNTEHRTVMVKGGLGVAAKSSGTSSVRHKQFDRNLDGASDLEIERARDKITNVVEVPKAVRLKFAHKLKRITGSLTQYFLLEVAPFDSAVDAALADASESFRLMTGSQTAEFSLGKAEFHLRRLTELKMLDWTCQRLKLPGDIRRMVLDDYMGRSSASIKETGSKELHELRKSAAVPRPEERRAMDLSTAQVQRISGSVVAALRREVNKN